MRLQSEDSLYNMGDTSIRVKKIVEINRIVLKELKNYLSNTPCWKGNTTLQENFYISFLDEIDRLEKKDGNNLFDNFERRNNYTYPDEDSLGFRARTLTNSLVKVGLVHSDRTLSKVGKKYLENTLSKADDIESILELDMDNLFYFRQLLKLRIYDKSSDNYFYNFRFAIKFLSKYTDVPQNHLLTIIESIRPTQSAQELENLISSYSDVVNGTTSFENFYASKFSNSFFQKDNYDLAKTMFENRAFDDAMFIEVFQNRDNQTTSLLYKKFLMKIIAIQENTASTGIISELYKLSRDARIKKAFGKGKIPINIKRDDTISSILEKNQDNLLFEADHFSKYLQFLVSKRYDLMKEYSDMSRRFFQITGMISFENGIANLNNRWIISPLLEILGSRFTLSGSDSYDTYESDNESDWFKDLTLTDIFSIEDEDINKLYVHLGHEFGTQDIVEIRNKIADRHEIEFRNFVGNNFPKEKVIEILNNIKNRDDIAVRKAVTETATISTIYEYILTIAWYYLSTNKSYKLSKSFQVSLDGNKLPLVHRGGGAGDIEIVSEDYSILLEATLMDINAQKRGELEPVIRHSTNFALSNLPNITQTIFIANELDNNVLNIFRAMQFIQLNGTLQNGNSVNGLNIFAFTTSEIILLLEREINDLNFLKCINSNLNNHPTNIQNGWRNQIVNEIFS